MRLTNEIRERLLTRVLSHGFKERQYLMKKAYMDFADKCYSDTYTPEIQSLISQLPNNFFPKVTTINMSFGGRKFQHNGSKTVPVGYLSYHGYINKLAEDHVLTDEFLYLEKENDALKKELADAKQNAKALLYSVQTMKRLLEVWPEIEAFTKDIVPEKIGLPAIQIVDLNKKLKLPPIEVSL